MIGEISRIICERICKQLGVEFNPKKHIVYENEKKK